MYMLDTDTCSYILREKPESVRDRFKSAPEQIVISEIVLAELRYGANKHQTKIDEILAFVDDFESRLLVIPWSASASYGRLRAHLEKAGTPIANLDTMIAAHSLELNATLVTNNTRHFKRVPELVLENWT